MRLFFSMLVILISGCSTTNPDWIVSPGRIDHYLLEAEVQELKKLWNALPIKQGEKPKELQIIGHGAGSYRHYPMDISSEDYPVGNNAKAKDVVHLVDSAFLSGHIDAVELDAQLPSKNHELCNTGRKTFCSFVIHNTPDWKSIKKLTKPHSFAFMQRNTVFSVLHHFVEMNYHHQGKMVYLEIKCDDNNPAVVNCIEAGIRVANHLKKIIANSSGQGKNNWLTITSFFPKALGSFYKTLSKEKLHNSVDYALIAGYDKPGFFKIKGWLAQRKGAVPEFDEGIQNYIATTPWLDIVWFSTRGISSPSTVLKHVDNMRASKCKDKAKPCTPLKYSVSSYDKPWDKFKNILIGEEPFSLPLISIMIDVDD